MSANWVAVASYYIHNTTQHNTMMWHIVLMNWNRFYSFLLLFFAGSRKLQMKPSNGEQNYWIIFCCCCGIRLLRPIMYCMLYLYIYNARTVGKWQSKGIIADQIIYQIGNIEFMILYRLDVKRIFICAHFYYKHLWMNEWTNAVYID